MVCIALTEHTHNFEAREFFTITLSLKKKTKQENVFFSEFDDSGVSEPINKEK